MAAYKCHYNFQSLISTKQQEKRAETKFVSYSGRDLDYSGWVLCKKNVLL